MTYAVSYKVGQEAVFYYGVAGTTAATEFGLVKTNAWGIERDAIEGNYRDSKYTNTRPGQIKLQVSVTGRRKVTDATYQALKAAAVADIGAGTVIAVKLLPVAGSTDEIIDGDFSVIKFHCEETINEYQGFQLELALNIDTREPSIT